MNNKIFLKLASDIANYFDDNGLYEEADAMDTIIIRIAQVNPIGSFISKIETYEQAEQEIQKIFTAYNEAHRMNDTARMINLHDQYKMILDRFSKLRNYIPKGINQSAWSNFTSRAGVAIESVGNVLGAEVGSVAAGGMFGTLAASVVSFLAGYGIGRWIINNIPGVDEWVQNQFVVLLKSIGYSDSNIPTPETMYKIWNNNKILQQAQIKQQQTRTKRNLFQGTEFDTN